MIEARTVLDKDPRRIRRMFAGIAHRYDRANRVLSMCFDVGWRRRLASRILPAPGRVLDLAAGTGDLTVDLERLGGHSVISADFTFEMLLQGRQKLSSGAPRARQAAADALHLPFRDASFDACAVAFGVRNFADPDEGLREIHRILRVGGTCSILEFSRPSRVVNVVYGLYFKHVLPKIGGAIAGSPEAYEYLPASVNDFPHGPHFLELMGATGFSGLRQSRLSSGIVTLYEGEKR